jgi:hypothetical protein
VSRVVGRRPSRFIQRLFSPEVHLLAEMLS